MTSRRPYLCTKQCTGGHKNPVGIELFPHVKTFFYSKQFAKLLTTWLKTIYISLQNLANRLHKKRKVGTRLLFFDFSPFPVWLPLPGKLSQGETSEASEASALGSAKRGQPFLHKGVAWVIGTPSRRQRQRQWLERFFPSLVIAFWISLACITGALRAKRFTLVSRFAQNAAFASLSS